VVGSSKKKERQKGGTKKKTQGAAFGGGAKTGRQSRERGGPGKVKPKSQMGCTRQVGDGNTENVILRGGGCTQERAKLANCRKD